MPLRLKSLDLHGYKTFASRTVFEFASGITAIVGPNGSGKSNIADSLRWVLGEQSYTLLRGKKTEDMIFSGSEHRPRAGMVSAEIVFDNSANWLPVDFSEVALARRAYRDGRNEYLLNGQHVRLRDMNELLAASGLSERTYTILGQGLVDASLALKADERRRLFEEAAGVGLYRLRREEAIRRLENTQHNLERVQDILAELEPRLKTLERQARRANDYAAAQADLRVLLREWYGYHWHHAQQELKKARETLHEQDLKVQEAREAHLLAQNIYGRFRERLSSLRAQLNTWHRNLSDLHSRRETFSRDLAVLEERRRSFTTLIATMIADSDKVSGEEKLAAERLAGAELETDHLDIEVIEARKQLENAVQALQIRQSEHGATEEQLIAGRDIAASLHLQKAETQARLDELLTRLEAYKHKLNAIQDAIHLADMEVKRANQIHREAQSVLNRSEDKLRQAEMELESRKKEVETLENERHIKVEDQTLHQTRYSRSQAQLEVLDQAEQSLAGYAEGARFLLDAARQSRLRAHGALSASLDVPTELVTAIAAALGDTLDAVLLETNQIEEALNLLESGEAGRAALLPLEGRTQSQLTQPEDADYLGLASSLISAPAELRAAVDLILGYTLVVRTRSAARRLITKLPIYARIVTLRGEVFRGDGLIIAGKSASTSTLGRSRQKRELSESLADLANRLEVLNTSIGKLTDDQKIAQREQSARAEDLRNTRIKFEQAQSAGQNALITSEAARRKLEWQKSQNEELANEISSLEKERERQTTLGIEIEEKAAQAQNEIRILTIQLSGLSLDEAKEQVVYWNTRLAVTEKSLNTTQAHKLELQQSLDRLIAQRAGLQSRLEEAQVSFKQLEEDKISLRENESGLFQQMEVLRVQIEPAEKDLESAEQEENRLQETEAVAQRNLSSAEHILAQVQIDQMRRQEAMDSLREKIIDDFGLVSFEYEESMEGPVPLPFEGLVEELPVVSELANDLEEQLTQQRAHLRRMGPINPEAKKEFDSESERYSFMTTQIQDLSQAEMDLRQVIGELDVLTRQEFSRTYEAVDKQFRAIFTRLFGGGSAHLSLTDPDNLVETGIEIEARLPGRREQGLSLLSGGERSLTAIALVFSLLKVSPTPVCVMDEVDAMLDEANVGRFRELLTELSKDTQFIVITHNRNTVQAADVIYGVTMGRDSASQIISLKLDEVSEELLGTNRQ
jgi:chromosome segregation protein